MFKIRVICPKSHDIKWVKLATEVYEKRCKHLCTLDLISPKQGSFDKTLSKYPNYIALDSNATTYSSLDFTKLVFKNRETNFVIGPSDGLTRQQKANASHLISLSKLTFTHHQCKIILLEQIYRSFQIKNNAPYHK